MSTKTTNRPAQIVKLVPSELKRYFAAKLAAELGPHNVKRLIELSRDEIVILDVRSSEAFRESHVPGAINIPFEQLPIRLKELSKQRQMISYCWDVTCLLATKASYILASKGYKAREMVGGIAAWQAAEFPVERG